MEQLGQMEQMDIGQSSTDCIPWSSPEERILENSDKLLELEQQQLAALDSMSKSLKALVEIYRSRM